MDSVIKILFIILVTLVCMGTLGIAGIYFLGWLSARTLPVTITPISPPPSVNNNLSNATTEEWKVLEIMANNQLRLSQNGQEKLVKLACILVNPHPTQARYAEDNLRGLTMNGSPKLQVDVLRVETDGSLLAELWVTSYGNNRQLAQAVLARKGYVTVQPDAKSLCPNAQAMFDAQAFAEKRLQKPLIIHF
jgi:hypothetical protein